MTTRTPRRATVRHKPFAPKPGDPGTTVEWADEHGEQRAGVVWSAGPGGAWVVPDEPRDGERAVLVATSRGQRRAVRWLSGSAQASLVALQARLRECDGARAWRRKVTREYAPYAGARQHVTTTLEPPVYHVADGYCEALAAEPHVAAEHYPPVGPERMMWLVATDRIDVAYLCLTCLR